MINICSESYQLSPNWEAKFQIYIPTEDDLLSKALYSNILRLKRQHLLEEIAVLEGKLETVEMEDDDLSILQEIKTKKEIEVTLAKELGAVIG